MCQGYLFFSHFAVCPPHKQGASQPVSTDQQQHPPTKKKAPSWIHHTSHRTSHTLDLDTGGSACLTHATHYTD
ncbi:hypothetical protein E2C01_053858 [Portunus trituberculatus]|uniref:Uncharacterized protein n=1 Tax=Portunus trituberculatus TaxID=210409 RepID=A0A5B7GHT1_PORTR|nr:hypothetical protein [Portunus trituberculatus]